MAVQALLLTSESNYLCGFEKAMKEHSIDIHLCMKDQDPKEIVEKMSIDIVIYSGASKDDTYLKLVALLKEYSALPVIAVYPSSAEVASVIDPSEWVHWVQPLTSKKMFIQQIVELVKLKRKVNSSLSSVVPAGPAPVGQSFFDTIEINKILDQALSHFGSKVLCKNVHWIQWKEIKHLSEADAESLTLEVETKYHRTPKIRSQHQEQVRHIVNLARTFPLKKRLPQLAQGGHLLQTVGTTQHLLFPIQESSGKKNISCLLVEDLHDGEPEFIIKMMREILSRMVRHIEFGYQLWDAQNLSFEDDLTDLYNQRYLPQVLDAEISRAKRSCTKFSVLFMDLDHFKKVNDSKGHWVGSRLLVEVGKIVKSNIRSCDYGFRYGGDEYVVILVDTDVDGAEVVGERLRKQVESTDFLVDGHSINLTVSVGVACFPDHAASRQEVIKMADEAMYLGKHKSRNIVYVAS